MLTFGDVCSDATLRYQWFATDAGAMWVAEYEGRVAQMGYADEVHPLTVADLQGNRLHYILVEAPICSAGTIQRMVDHPQLWTGAIDHLSFLVMASELERVVWLALCDVPFGATVSYGELAARVGRPRASRAVASAVGRNPLAYVIPCHRVVRSDGSMGGYRWGIERKRQLLEWERDGIYN